MYSFPHFQEHDVMNCGPTCLRMVAGYYGKNWLQGCVEVIKNIPTDSGYLSKVNLPNGLVTNYSKQLYFTNGMRV